MVTIIFSPTVVISGVKIKYILYKYINVEPQQITYTLYEKYSIDYNNDN